MASKRSLEGTAAVNFTVADGTRYYDPQAKQWKQAGETTDWSVEVFGGLAERVTELAHKGQAAGRRRPAKTRTRNDQHGNSRRELRINADDVAPSWSSAPPPSHRQRQLIIRQTGEGSPPGGPLRPASHSALTSRP